MERIALDVLRTTEQEIPSTEIYRTSNLEFASTEVAADRLTYIGAELQQADGRQVNFLLHDPYAVAAADFTKFINGLTPRVHARLLFDVRNLLLNEVKRVRDARA